jgi:proteasome beta subunit
MSLPSFSFGSDPGPSFSELLRRVGLGAPMPVGSGEILPGQVHATTIVAMRYADGVVMAGDRRATAGNIIANRSMEKVFPADRHSGVSISGSAGAASEMVKLFQLELEHYEKVEGIPLTLEGKATRLGNMVRGNLPAAFQMGMVVIPILAGYDLNRRTGRIFDYDVTGGRYEEKEFSATGSGGRFARSVIKLRWRPDISREAAIDIAIESLFEAADEDSATGGPDAIRGIYPQIATITADGYDEAPETEVSGRFMQLVDQLRGARGVPGAVSNGGPLL